MHGTVLCCAQAAREPSMDGAAYLRCLKEAKTVTRKGDLRHDFPELAARKVTALSCHIIPCHVTSYHAIPRHVPTSRSSPRAR